MRRQKKKNKINLKYILIVIFILTCAFLIYRSFAKYVIRVETAHAQESTEFYMESDLENSTIYWTGKDTKTIDFYVRNYTNNLLKSGDDVEYTINVNSSSENVSVECSNLSSEKEVLSNENLSKNNYTLNITSNGDFEVGTSIDITVTINSTISYTKEIKAVITLIIVEPYEVDLIDNGEYVSLYLKMNTSQDVLVTYDNNLLTLDTSSYLVNLISETVTDTKNSFVLSKEKLKEGYSYEIHFIKVDSSSEITLGTDIVVE